MAHMKTDQPKASQKFFTIGEIAGSIGASERTVRRWIDRELLIAHKFNRLVRISEADFLAFLASRRGD